MHHFTAIFPGKPCLASSRVFFSLCWSLTWISSWVRPKLFICSYWHNPTMASPMSPTSCIAWASLHHLFIQHVYCPDHLNLPLLVTKLTGFSPSSIQMPWLQLRFDCGTTTIRLWCIACACFQFDASKKWTCQFFVIVISQSNRMHIVILITSVVVECVMVLSYRSRIVVKSQLWYRLKLCIFLHFFLSKPTHPSDHMPKNQLSYWWVNCCCM